MFFNFLSDAKKMYKAECEKSFSFEPDTMIGNAREFTDALLQYAQENDRDITIRKESMYPEFRWMDRGLYWRSGISAALARL